MKKYIIFFLLLLLATKLFYWLGTFPNADEAYYWLWGRRPALSYHDHPAFQSLLQGFFYTLFGKSLFVLRLPAFLCTVLISILFYNILKKLKQDSSAISIILIILITPIFFVFTSFVWHDYLMITLSLASVYFWLNYLHDIWDEKKGSAIDIFLAFLFLGLAGISKYNSVFIALGVFSTVLSNRKLYSVFKDYRFYVGIIFAAILISPIFIWNMQNSFGSFEFNIQQRVLQPFSDSLFRGNILGYIFGSIIMLSPIVWFGIIKIWRKTSVTDTDSYSLVYRKLAKQIFLVSTLSFLFLSLFANVLYYWNIPAYLLVMPLAAEFLIRKKLALASLIYAGVLNVFIVFHFGILPLNVLTDSAVDRDAAHHYGWKQIGNKIKTIKESSSNELQILTSSYRTASLLAFELDDIDIYAYSPRFDQFDYWTKDIKYEHQDALILTEDWQRMNAELQVVCGDIAVIDTIKISKWGYPIKEYYLYTGKIIKEFLK